MAKTTFLFNNKNEDKKTLSNLDNVFSSLNGVFSSLSNVFSNNNKEYYSIVESNILNELKNVYSKLKHNREIVRTKIYKEIFYMKDYDIKVDAEEYIRYMRIFEDDIEGEYKELKRNADLIKDEYKNKEFQNLIDEYYSVNKLTKAITIYLNTNS